MKMNWLFAFSAEMQKKPACWMELEAIELSDSIFMNNALSKGGKMHCCFS